MRTDTPEVHTVSHLGHGIHVQDHAGGDPPVVLLHGFPDNLRLYDRLVPHLESRRVLAVDFLGWGASDKPVGYLHTAHDQTAELAAVLDALSPAAPVVLVAHDASGPPAVDYALLHPARVAALVLLNTYYAASRTLRAPEAVILYFTPGLRRVARAVARRARRWCPRCTATSSPPGRPWRLTADLPSTLHDRRGRVPDLARLPVPVRVVFGARDPYLGPRVARELAGWFGVEPVLVPDAGHYVQVDAPAAVAHQILGSPIRRP